MQLSKNNEIIAIKKSLDGWPVILKFNQAWQT
jgi:hypothetical protein